MRLRLAALTVAVGLGFVGLASAQEPTSWFKMPAWFSPAPAKKDEAKKADLTADLAPIAVTSTNNQRAARAKADLDRRQEVCLKLREIAIALGDDDLLRKAELLDQRAFDLYLAVKNQGPGPVEPAAQKGGR
jgi:hypothetical protein